MMRNWWNFNGINENSIPLSGLFSMSVPLSSTGLEPAIPGPQGGQVLDLESCLLVIT